MLKIKDEIDLKLLENYGFVSLDNCKCFNNYSYVNNCGTGTNRIWVNKKFRHLSINNPSGKVLNVIYDLIIDGLVERYD